LPPLLPSLLPPLRPARAPLENCVDEHNVLEPVIS